MAVPAAIELVDVALKATTAYERPDLAARLGRTAERLADPDVRVLVVGEFKQGKSQLVNALVKAPGVPGRRRHRHRGAHRGAPRRDTPSVALVRERRRQRHAGAHRGAARASWPSTSPRPATRATGPGCSYAEVGLPRKLLAGGLVLVDTPGVGGLGSAHGAATMSALPSADAVLLVSDAAQEYTAPGAGVPAPRP